MLTDCHPGSENVRRSAGQGSEAGEQPYDSALAAPDHSTPTLTGRRLERAEQIGEFDRLRKQVEARDGKRQTGQVDQSVSHLSDGRRKGPQHKPNGISQLARELGRPRKEVSRDMQIAKLSEPAKAARRLATKFGAPAEPRIA
ncbi:hypothetical protein [Methylocystis sp.]|uniref:hypothetical protein n=1 Tax=Methylocystis sp. TaxID=1911079 RepID=UPI003DA1E25C